MGIIAALFSLVTINFEAFKSAIIDLKFILTMNLTLCFVVVVYFGLLHIIIKQKKNSKFIFFYIFVLFLIIAATIGVFIFL